MSRISLRVLNTLSMDVAVSPVVSAIGRMLSSRLASLEQQGGLLGKAGRLRRFSTEGFVPSLDELGPLQELSDMRCRGSNRGNALQLQIPLRPQVDYYVIDSDLVLYIN